MSLKIELRRFVRGYYFAITHETIFYTTEPRIADFLGLDVIEYRMRLNRCLGSKGSLGRINVLFFESEDEKKRCIENFKEEFAPELTLLQI